ncbi:MAG: DUF3795 domain-containing protein [Bacillota bacterium]
MERMIAYCGLICTECEGYLATQADDREALERWAKKVREEYGSADATAESLRCDGCLAESGPKCGYCAVCEIRACGVARAVPNCGRCSDYADCEKLQGFFAMAPQARAVLEEVAAGRSSH